ncbi:hypothetical protein [Micromonospora sp. NPDC004704]
MSVCGIGQNLKPDVPLGAVVMTTGHLPRKDVSVVPGTIMRVRDTVPDGSSDPLFRHLPTTYAFGTRRFPSPADYLAVVAEHAAPQSDALTRLQCRAQRDWHVRGQTGCMFARLAALQANTLRWDYLVLRPPPDRLVPEDIIALGRLVDEAVADARTELLSILVPEVGASDPVGFIHALTRHSKFWLEADEIHGGNHRLHLRYPVGRGVQAWVMAFGPFEYLPSTRRGPYFELVIRAKGKPDVIFHRLNPERSVAHLADTPLVMTERNWEHRWVTTMRRTRMILGGEPDSVSAAKATLVAPIRNA